MSTKTFLMYTIIVLLYIGLVFGLYGLSEMKRDKEDPMPINYARTIVIIGFSMCTVAVVLFIVSYFI